MKEVNVSMDVTYRQLTMEECEKINEMDASQYIGKAWREVDGRRQLVDINYQDPTWPNGYAHHDDGLRKTIAGGGSAIGAFSRAGKLLGFVTVNRGFFGKSIKYVLLDQLFISLEHRRKGIGQALFTLATKVADEWGADGLYICAGSAEETIAFYFALGCRPASEVDEKLSESDPNDYQLEYML